LADHHNYRFEKILLVLAALLNFSGLFITILGPDGALYATIAKTMVLRDDYIQMFVEGRDWLDKPHFPFWITALSFKIFGFQTWAYKLPAILFLLVGAFYTFRLASQLYNERIAYWSAIILLTAEHIIISNNDVRAEPYLTGLIIASVYHYAQLLKIVPNSRHKPGANLAVDEQTNQSIPSTTPRSSVVHLIAGSLFAACAIMTKGMFALVPICGAIAIELIIKKNFRSLFHWQWIIAAILIAIFIIPELYCLWYQFDSHPEKNVFGRTGVSGIRFFFWDSQFGRFMNTGPIKGKGDPSFFIHTTLWAFLPWSIVFYAALVARFIAWKRRIEAEWLTVAAATLTFLLFSASKFQLPHYINIVFPFFAIITAAYIYHSANVKRSRFIAITQNILVWIMLAGTIALHFIFQPDAPSPVAIILVLLFFVAAILMQRRRQLMSIPSLHSKSLGSSSVLSIGKSVMAVCGLNLYLNLIMYPELMKYQSGSEAARFMNATDRRHVIQLRQYYSYAFEFYFDGQVTSVDSLDGSAMQQGRTLFIPEDALPPGIPAVAIKLFEHYPVSRLNGKFINKNSRKLETETFALYDRSYGLVPAKKKD
jgi:4-amino-4-deoxy-L-arabinose transferase-like glycosyltransferase